mmetsp:Transcript_11369/g.13477  ORF Transcript_11369/g.13477 Transcript_11369/m.13477 type:complete len:199 (-) Transcript_11369:200-796(-)|eukprot:CAMPEP_0197852378 /NCGR_PEP_ID=MMETSP1438-20131217/20429_1 /TAXON_ID=1461541 /ORGANISM="Pterosperma sp., Strain CCMP1384" /LENGTH=198 /DNA_ID=CAMNT_0043466403 /DNA_START=431 /DNA_END=1027 /DNA_ORIENTATION=+
MADKYVPPPEDHIQSFVVKLATFLGEGDFEQATTQFLTDNASKLPISNTEEEQSLESFDVYKRFLGLVEEKLEGYVSSMGMSEEDFQIKCIEASNSDEAACTFIDTLIASWDYEKFVELSKRFVESVKQEKERGEKRKLSVSAEKDKESVRAEIDDDDDPDECEELGTAPGRSKAVDPNGDEPKEEIKHGDEDFSAFV